MFFNLICFLMIALITLYLATQGMLSSLIALVTATFSSILAMALMEPLQSIIGNFRPDYGRGCTFLLLFFLAFSATRIVGDMAVPENIKLPQLINRLMGGFVGFFVALVVVGTIIIGVEMLPLGTTLLGYDRFPGDRRMQGDSAGVAAAPTNTWFAPERFVLAIWNGASGRGLGGAMPFEDVHPDMDAESYGYRNTIFYASNHTLLPDLMEVKAAWTTGEPKELDPLGIKITEAGKKIAMVRTSIKRGTSDKGSADLDSTYMRITPTEVRLVTDKGRQYYPIGYLKMGTRFVPLSLDTGQVVDDYAKEQVLEDWVFQINDDEKPQMIEMKELARADIGGLVKDNVLPPEVAAMYPPKGYQKEASTLTVTMAAAGGAPIVEGKVYLIRSALAKRDMSSQLSKAYEHIKDVIDQIEAGKGGWTADGKPGIPGRGYFGNASRTAINFIEPKAAADEIPISQAMTVLMAGPIRPDAAANFVEIPRYIDEELIPMFSKTSSGNAIMASGKVDASGSLVLPDIPKGSLFMLATLRTEKGFYYWTSELNFEPHSAKTLTLNSSEAAEPKIDLP